MSTQWILLILIGGITLVGIVAIGFLVWFFYTKTTPAGQDVPFSTLLGVSVLGVIALVCVSGVAIGLSAGQTGSIETIQQGEQAANGEQAAKGEQTAQDKQTETAQDKQTEEKIEAGTVGVVSNSQGLGILATIASAAVGGIAGVLVQRTTP